jgi:uncharacterized membrane protein
MGSGARIGQQPINQFLVLVPIALFTIAVMFDAASVLTDWRLLGEVGYWDLIAGLIAAVLAVGAGLLDVRALFVRSPNRLTGARHTALMIVTVALFALAWADRRHGGHAGGGVTLAVELLALAAASVAVWLARGLVVHGT